MMRKSALVVALLAFVISVPVHAQEQSDGTLHVLRPIIHAEQEDAEFCLEFDHDLDVSDHHRAAASVKLESGGKNLPVAARNVSIAANLLCLSSLEYRREYRLAVASLRGAKGEKLAGAYSLGFSIPDRPASLAFTGETDAGGLIRWQDPILRALNVSEATLELYRVTDPATMTEAWRTRRQASLAPSESATFAHDHGQSVWKGEIAIDGEANKVAEQKISLSANVNNAPPGLYLIAARAPETRSGTKNLAATGAIWLLRSSLRLSVMRDDKGFYALTEKTDGPGVVKDARLVIEDTNGQKLAEGKSDADGILFLSLPGDKQDAAAVLAGFTNAGDADFIDLKHAPRFASSGNEISLTTDKAFYTPASTVTVDLAARDAEGHAMAVTDASLKLQWPDGNVYLSMPAPAGATGVAHLSFPAPAANGNWQLTWQRTDGTVLANGTLRVTSSPDAPRFEMSSDRTFVSPDGGLELTLKSLVNDGKPAPYLTGQVFGSWMPPDHVFQEWKDYTFGKGGNAMANATSLASFVTDQKGVAALHISLTPPDDGAPIHAIVLHAQDNGSEGVAPSPPLTLPVRPKGSIIGIKPLMAEGRFPENGLARFNVIALDPDGHRKSEDDLTYQVYEEGRSFDWRQTEGRWDYKPQEQIRRIGGGSLALEAAHDSIIEWPVAAGTYRLEITDADGAIRASIRFSAGWGVDFSSVPQAPLALASSFAVLHPAQEAQIRFSLDNASMISAFIGDDRIRKVIHQPMLKGENTIAFTPDKDWGNRINVDVVSDDLNAAGRVTLPFLPEGSENGEKAKPQEPSPAEIFSADPHFPLFLREGDVARLTLGLKNNGVVPAAYRLVVSGPPGVKSSGLSEAPSSLASGQSKDVSFTLDGAHAGEALVKIDVSMPPHLHETHEWPIAILANDGLVSASPQKIETRQSWVAPVDKSRGKTGNDIIFIAASPLYNLPSLLADMLAATPFTVTEISGTMEALRLWHDTIIAAGLRTGEAFDAQRQGLLLRLMARQKTDGGFSSTPSGAADILSTAQALIALAHADAPAAKPAMELAAGWLRHRLENSWFDEKERPLRASAYAALAEAGKLDTANLHYFGDTSGDKALPPLAAAQLAYAFAVSGDQGSASWWLDASGARKNPADIAPALFRTLAATTIFDPQTLLPVMEKTADEMEKNNTHDINSATGFLRALWSVQQRKGAWGVTVGSDKRNPTGVLVLSEKTLPPIHNTGDNPLFLVRTHDVPRASQGPVARHIYQLSGTEMDTHTSLERGQAYLVVLESPWPAKESSLSLFHDDVAPGLRPIGCLPPEPVEADDTLAWLKSQSLAPLTDCEISGNAIDMTAAPNKSTNGWRAAYLARAESIGIFQIAPASVRNLDGSLDILWSRKDRIEIR